MKECRANILSEAVLHQADAIGITTNGIIRSDGRAVMGAGVAKSFRDTYVGIDRLLAVMLRLWGNHVHLLTYTAGPNGGTSIFSFPTKNHWRDKSDLELIENSAGELVKLANEQEWENIWLPRPGCSNGGLNWTTQVKPLIEPIFDDRFTICYL